VILLKIDLTINNEEILTIISDFIRTYIENSGSKGVVIGLSGGIDSAVTAIICKKILGKKRSKCIFLPDNATSLLDIEHTNILINKYDLSCEEININKNLKNIYKIFNNKPSKNTIANIKTRLRMLILYEYANMTNSIVCGTSNKSELLIGYFTKYGDGGVDINPLGDLYKSQIYNLAKYLKIPNEIINKPPSPGLLKNQFDEIELKITYKNLDLILAGLENKIDLPTISKLTKIKKSEIKRINQMIIQSQHKRRFALIPKIGIRTPGLDWRIPIQLG
jgi:NAD+ synthase